MRFKAIFIKESILIFRDKRALFLVIIFPVVMLLLYSYGVTFDIKNVPVAILDYCQSSGSRDLINDLNSTEYLDVIQDVKDYDDINHLFVRNRIMLALIIPADFEEKIARGQKTTLQVLANGSDANTANVALGYLTAIVVSHGAELIDYQMSRRGQASIAGPAISPSTRIWYNPELKSAYFIAPGVIAVIMMLLGSLLTSTSIVREKETGTIEMLVSTPVRSRELILGKILPYVIICLVDISIVIIIAHFFLGVPVKGNIGLLLLGALLFLTCALGVGLFASAVSSSVSSSQMIALFLGLLPSVLLSGFIFPIESMPEFVQAITYVVPAKYFIIILRGIFLKGASMDVLWPQFLFLLVFGSLLLMFAVSKFEKKIG